MIETSFQSVFSNIYPDKAANYNGWPTIIGIISCIGAYAFSGQTIHAFFPC